MGKRKKKKVVVKANVRNTQLDNSRMLTDRAAKRALKAGLIRPIIAPAFMSGKDDQEFKRLKRLEKQNKAKKKKKK